MEEGRLREPRVELPRVGSQSLLSCLCHLQIKEVLKSGACGTRVSFRVGQFLSSPNCRIHRVRHLGLGFILEHTTLHVIKPGERQEANQKHMIDR